MTPLARPARIWAPCAQAIVQDALTLLKHNRGVFDLHTFDETKVTLTSHLQAFEYETRYLTVSAGGLQPAVPAVSHLAHEYVFRMAMA
jgi:hypothetical protein